MIVISIMVGAQPKAQFPLSMQRRSRNKRNASKITAFYSCILAVALIAKAAYFCVFCMKKFDFKQQKQLTCLGIHSTLYICIVATCIKILTSH